MNEYSNDGQGLYKTSIFNEDYYYTQFEAWHAHKVFPCFDQPDLKATYEFTCFADPNLTVVSNEFTETITRIGEGNWESYMISRNIHKIILADFEDKKPLMHIFKQTQRFSTYLFAFGIGNLVCFEHKGPMKYSDGKPGPYLRAFVRPQFAELFNSQSKQFFELIQSAISFISEYLDFPYPYSKYDQVFMPNFRYGGMENSGCVVFAENFAVTGTKSAASLYILVHELAHHWFGNTITMNWWSNLFLNEGFATFMGHFCIAHAKGMELYAPQIWNHFFKSKTSLYTRESHYSHPIMAELDSTENAESLIDAITYEKSASVLKQVWYLLGDEAFRFALRNYIKTNASGNVGPDDLIKSFEQAAIVYKKTDLINFQIWGVEWLYTMGTNTIQPFCEVAGENIAKFYIRQNPDDIGIYRTHMIKIALFYGNFECKYVENVLVNPAESTEVKQLEGIKAPLAIFLNADDFAHVKTLMDPVSEELFKSGAIQATDSLTLKMVAQVADLQIL